METIELKVKVSDEKQLGTIGWLNDYLKNSYIKIEGTAMYLVHTHEYGENNHLIVKVNNGYDSRFLTEKNGELLRVRTIENDFEYGLFDFSLTPECEIKVQELIDKSVDFFANWWKNDHDEVNREIILTMK